MKNSKLYKNIPVHACNFSILYIILGLKISKLHKLYKLDLIGNVLTIQPPSVSINSLGVWPTEEQDGLITINDQ